MQSQITPRIGDRVRVVRPSASSGSGYVGRVGTVVAPKQIPNGCQDQVFVQLDRARKLKSIGLFFKPECLTTDTEPESQPEPEQGFVPKSVCEEASQLLCRDQDGYLALSLICTDGGTQSRAGLSDGTIDEYAEAMDSGATFPPVLVFYNGSEYWLADGFHRVAAAKRLKWIEIAAEVRSGTLRDAVLYSVGANATHGLRRTNADKRRAVEILLRDSEWSQWSDGAIALQCGVSQPFVSKLRAKSNLVYDHYGSGPTHNRYESDTTHNRYEPRKGLDGRIIKTANIGTRGNTALVSTSSDSVEQELLSKAQELGLNPKKDQVLPEQERNYSSPLDVDDRPFASPPLPQRVEINTNDICIALISNVEYLTDDQVEAVWKAIYLRLKKAGVVA